MEKSTGKIVALEKTTLHEEGAPPTTLGGVLLLRMLSRDPHVVSHRLLDVKQGQNKESKTVIYLVLEYMDTDLKKYIHGFKQTGENIATYKCQEFDVPTL